MILHKRLLTDDPLTLQSIADSFDISRERVRQIEVTLLKKMRLFLEEEMPDIVDFFAEDMIVA
jgi:RNA polymerase sigma-32 factor